MLCQRQVSKEACKNPSRQESLGVMQTKKWLLARDGVQFPRLQAPPWAPNTKLNKQSHLGCSRPPPAGPPRGAAAW